LLEEFEHDLDDLVLIPSRGGVFEVTLNDELVFSKKQAGRHAEYDDILKEIRSRARA